MKLLRVLFGGDQQGVPIFHCLHLSLSVVGNKEEVCSLWLQLWNKPFHLQQEKCSLFHTFDEVLFFHHGQHRAKKVKHRPQELGLSMFKLDWTGKDSGSCHGLVGWLGGVDKEAPNMVEEMLEWVVFNTTASRQVTWWRSLTGSIGVKGDLTMDRKIVGNR